MKLYLAYILTFNLAPCLAYIFSPDSRKLCGFLLLTGQLSYRVKCKIFLVPAARPKGWAAQMFLKDMTRCKIWFPPSRTILLLLENSLQSFPENGWSLPRAPSNRRSQSRNFCRAVSADHGHLSLELVATSHGFSWNTSLRSAGAHTHQATPVPRLCEPM